jgi:polyisoprenyl-phosphate glycosyltransferase
MTTEHLYEEPVDSIIDSYRRGAISLEEAAGVARLSPKQLLTLVTAAEQEAPQEEDIFFSAILPVYNEEENLPALIERLVPTLEKFGTYEIVFANDGSRDSSVAQILKARETNPNIKLVDLSRNFGHQAALSAGIAYAQGRVLCLMDADLQDPPEELPRFVNKWREGYDVIYAIREKRKENLFKRTAYYLFYRLLRSVSDIPIPLDSGDFCVMDRKVADEMLLLPEKNRFLRGLRSWVGFTQTGVAYERAARHAGEPKYTFRSLVKLAIDGLVSFTTRPLRLATYFGFISALIGIAVLIFVLILFISGISAPKGWYSLISVILIICGIQLMVMGIHGEYIGRIYDEVKSRPKFIVSRVHGARRRVPRMAADQAELQERD